ncbi:hypothetical protein [Streptomyces microflavus]|uniref:hypothetical protein n=1 Tax=Streptomyces microflavus TaxID=1919 RepID=UPI0033DBA87E
MSEQLTAEDVAGMFEWQINEARREGRLDDLTAQLNKPTSPARSYTVPTDPATGDPVPQLGTAEVKAMRPGGIVAAHKAGKLTAYAAGHDVSPPPPEVSAPAPVG